MERKLASIQTIHDIQPIYTLDGDEANSIELAHVLGWSVIVKKHEFQENDPCVFFEIDSILPEQNWSEFLRSKKFHIKTMKLNNMRTANAPVISQGLVLPAGILDEVHYEWIMGEDVTELLGVTKYERVEEWTKQGNAKGKFHPFVPKTDELRLQSFPDALTQMLGLPYYITQKLDGTSCTVVKDDNGIHVYSRNLGVGESSNYYQTALSQGLIDVVNEHPYRAIQGEIIGENIQANRLGVKGNHFFAFSIFNLVDGIYEGYKNFIRDCEAWEIPHVPILDIGNAFDYTMEELEEFSNEGHYSNGFPQEGIVIRPQTEKYSSILGGRLSFKVININFLLRIKE